MKSLLVIPELKILISGGSDKDLRIWDLAKLESEDWSQVENQSLAESLSAQVDEVVEKAKQALDLKKEEAAPSSSPFAGLPFIKSLKGQHTRPVEALSYYAVMKVEDDNKGAEPTGTYAVWSADSMGRICVWELSRKASALQASFKYTWLAHETAINEIRMAEEECWTGRMLRSLHTGGVGLVSETLALQSPRITWQPFGASISLVPRSHLCLQ